jgi:flagellar protein FliO/FliZ
MEDFYKAIALLIGFGSILFVAYLTTKALGAKFISYSRGKYIKVVDRIMLGKDKWIHLVKIGNVYYLVGSTNQNIELLGQIDKQEIVPLSSEIEKGTFQNTLERYINKIGFKNRMNDHD